MRTIRIKLYQFSELSKQAQQAAFERWVSNAEYLGDNDATNSLEKFADHFGATLKDYSLDWNYYESYRNNVKFDTDGIDLGEKELKALIKQMGSYNKETLRGDGDCAFTGYCLDEDAADGARKAFFEGERDLGKILLAGFDTWYKAASEDYAAQQTMEYYEDHASANEYEFTKDGELFHK